MESFLSSYRKLFIPQISCSFKTKSFRVGWVYIIQGRMFFRHFIHSYSSRKFLKLDQFPLFRKVRVKVEVNLNRMSDMGDLSTAFMEYHKYKVKTLEEVLAKKNEEIAALRADLEAERAKNSAKERNREDATVSAANGAMDNKTPSDFDVVPTVHDPVPPYKCKVPAPRTKREKAALPGQSCECCEDYFNSFPEKERQQRINESSKHRSRQSLRTPKTPEKYWDMNDWPPSPEAVYVGPVVTKRRKVLKIVPYEAPK